MRSRGTTAKRSGGMRSAAGWLGLVTFLLACLLAQSETDNGVLRSRVYKLRHANSETVKAMLIRLKIGTEYNALSSDALIVTSDRTLDLVKATSVVTLADSATPVEIRPLFVQTETEPGPAPAELAVRLKTMTLGTLLDAPPSGVPNTAIVDTFEGTLIAIGTPETLGMIETAVQAWKNEKSPQAAAEPDVPAMSQEEAKSAADPNAAEKPAEVTPEEEPNQIQTPSLEAAAAEVFGDTKTEEIAAEPNTAEVPVNKEQLATNEFMSQELMETLDAEAKKAEVQQPEPNSLQESAEAIQPEKEEGTAAEDKKAAGEGLRAALMDMVNAAKEKKRLAAEAETKTEPSAATGDKKEEAKQPEGKALTGPELLKSEEELELTITLPEEIEIEALLELVGKQLGLNYMYDPVVLKGQKVMLKVHDGKIKVREMYSLLESVLRFKGFVMTRRDNLVTIVKSENIANIDPVLRHPDEPIQPGDVVVSSIYELKHVSTTTMQNMLTQMRLGSGFNAIPETNTLVITDYAFRMERIREVIAMVDVEGQPRDFHFRQLKYMQALDLVTKVKAMAPQIQGLTITVGGTPTSASQIDPRSTRRPVTAQVPGQPGQPQPPQPVQPQAMATPAPDKQTVYLEADERTNRVLMIGYAGEIEIVNKLIDSLDVGSYDLRVVREYVIQNVEATDVITVLNELGLARVTVSTGQGSQAASQRLAQQRQQVLQPGQPQQPQPTLVSTPAGAAGNVNEPQISLRSATNSLLVNATDEQHKAIELVISHVDVLQKDQRTIREYEIQYVDTQSILDTLTELKIISPRETANSMSSRSTSASSSRSLQQQQMQMPQQVAGMAGDGGLTALPTAEGTEREITAQEPKIAVLASTNSLLVHATPRQHASIAMVIAHADRQLDRMFAPYVVYALENQDPDVLAEVLNKLIQETVKEASGAPTSPSAPDAKIQTKPVAAATLPSGEEQTIKIIPDKDSRSIIVYANKRNQQWVGDLIRKLDEYRPQVLLDVTLVNITRDNEFKFDLDLVSRKGGFAPGGTAMTKLTPIVTPFPAGAVAEGSSNYGTGAAFYSDSNIQAMLDLLDKKNYGRILAKPSILVKDNQEGIIKTENVIYVAEPKVDTVTPATGASSTNTSVSFKEYMAGLTLTITPHIAAENLLQLEIVLDRKDFAAGEDRTITIEGNTYTYPKNTTSSNIDTWSILPDGATIILGGIESLNQGKTINKVPILGDLPLIGLLFRGINEKDVQSRLYVFVKANIIRPGDELTGKSDIERISQKKRKGFEDFESQFQDLQALPGFKPNPIQPEKVLEDDEYFIEALRKKLDASDKPVTVEVPIVE